MTADQQKVFLAELLPNLPTGAVVIWNQNPDASGTDLPGYFAGHISIANGHGQEISDRIRPQNTWHYAGGGCLSIFYPLNKQPEAPKGK